VQVLKNTKGKAMKIYRCLENGENPSNAVSIENEVVEVVGLLAKLKSLMLLYRGAGEITVWVNKDT